METMRAMKNLIKCIIFIHFIFESTGSTHWIVTENGRIKAQDDSPFDLRRPDDFMAFLAQEERVETYSQLTHDLILRKDAMAARWSGIETHTELEGRLRLQDPDCIRGMPLPDCNLYVSTLIEIDESNRTILENVTSSNDLLPECLPLDFSLHLFEHLSAMQNRKNLSIDQEIKLIRPDMKNYGKRLSSTLRNNQTSWQIFNLVTEFWRAKGDAPRAMECVRWALHLSPASVRHIALLHLGNILHQAKRSAEAAIVLHAAVDHFNRDPSTHFTLGNIYTVLGDFTRAVGCLDNALKLNPNYDEASKTRFSVLCHTKVSDAINELKGTLHGLLHDLEDCQEMRTQRLQLQQLIIKERRSPFSISLFGDPVRADLDASMIRLDASLQNLLNAVQSMDHKITSKKSEPSCTTQVNLEKFEWPAPEDCQNVIKTKINPALFYIAPENSGHNIEKILGEMLDLKYANHPLPWHPPLCSENENGSRKLQSRIKTTLKYLLPPNKPIKLLPEPELMNKLLNYVGRESGMEEEFGQRILTAIKNKSAPKWLLLTLAGLYWRAKGLLQPSIQCFIQSYQLAPDEHLDIAIVPIASILFTQGHKYEAKSLLLRSIMIHKFDFTSNIFMSLILVNESEYGGARYHIDNSLKTPKIQDTDLINFAKIIACKVVLYEEEQQVCQQESPKEQCKIHIETAEEEEDDDSMHCIQTTDPEDLQSAMARFLFGKSEEDEIDESFGILNGENDQVLDILQQKIRADESEQLQKRASEFISLFASSASSDDPETWGLARSDCVNTNPNQDWSSYMMGVSSRDIELNSQLPELPSDQNELDEPFCREDIKYPKIEKLDGVRYRERLNNNPEPGLGPGLRLLADAGNSQSIKDIGCRIGLALNKNETSWVLATAAALYWRVLGEASNAVICLRQALKYAPKDVRDIPLISLANVFHRAGFLEDASTVAKMALESAPKFVITHFTLANIFSAKGELGKAMVFYQSALRLQPTFEPARHRLKAILCSLLYPDANINLSMLP